jgi:tol-pal system protein YbgF
VPTPLPLLRRWLPLAIATLTLAACESTPAQPDPTLVKLNDVDERLGRVERVVNNQSLLQLSQRIDGLEAQLRQLRGELEELQNSNDMLRKQQRDLYADLDRRLSALQAGAKNAAAGSGDAATGGTGGSAGADGGGDQSAYAHAFDALKSTDYAGAIARFRDFMRTYPQSQLAGNAQYWLGEAFYVTHDYDNAAAAFRAVGEQYPQSPKVPDALLKLGLTQIDQKKLVDARSTLKQVVQRFPGTDAAKLAASRLQSIPPDEH